MRITRSSLPLAVIALVACAEPTEPEAEVPPLAEFAIELPDEPGAVYTAVATGAAPTAGDTLEIEIVDLGHPGRLQSVVCPTDDPIQGCPAISWELDVPPSLVAGGAELFLNWDHSLAEAWDGEGDHRSLGWAPEVFAGPMPAGLAAGEWTLTLPLVHWAQNAPDPNRTAAELRVRVRAR